MARQDRLVELDLGGSAADQTRDLLPERAREVERERLLRTIVLVIRKGREREGTGQDGFHGRLRVRLGELPFVPEDGLFPGDRSAHDRLTVVRVRVEVPNESADLDGRELSRDVALTVVPRNLAVGDRVDPGLVLLAQDRLDDLPFRGSQLGRVDLPFVETGNRTAKGLLLRPFANPRVTANDRRSDQEWASREERWAWMMGIV